MENRKTRFGCFALFRGDPRRGLRLQLGFETIAKADQFAVNLELGLESWDREGATPNVLISTLERFGRNRGRLSEKELLVACMNINWLQKRGHLTVDRNNGIEWIMPSGESARIRPSIAATLAARLGVDIGLVRPYLDADTDVYAVKVEVAKQLGVNVIDLALALYDKSGGFRAEVSLDVRTKIEKALAAAMPAVSALARGAGVDAVTLLASTDTALGETVYVAPDIGGASVIGTPGPGRSWIGGLLVTGRGKT